MHHITLHPENPEKRHLTAAANAYKAGSTLVIPSESGYRLLLPMSAKLKKDTAPIVWLCQDISQASAIACIDNSAHRLLKSHVASDEVGHVTFVFEASKGIPKPLKQKNTVTIAFSRHPVVLALMTELPLPTLALAKDANIGTLADYHLDMGALDHFPMTVTDLS